MTTASPGFSEKAAVTEANYQLFTEPHGWLIRFFGKIDSKQLREIVERAQAKPFFDGHVRYILDDFTRCSELTLEPGEVEHLAATDWAASLSHKRPLVILMWPNRPDVAAVAAAYEAFNLSPWPVHLFANEDDARRWLAELRYLTR